MEDYLKYKTFRIKEMITEETINELIITSEKVPGIEKFKGSGQVVSFIYNPYEISEKEISDWLLTFGLSVKKNKDNWFKRRLAKLAKDNKENLGNQRLDCCDLNN
jgi:hypothetical protein